MTTPNVRPLLPLASGVLRHRHQQGERAYDAAAEMLGFCVLGPQGFTEANDLRLTEATEARLEAALEAGDCRVVSGTELTDDAPFRSNYLSSNGWFTEGFDTADLKEAVRKALAEAGIEPLPGRFLDFLDP